MLVAVYDLDKTLVKRATFTPFLVFAAIRLAPFRILFLPLWVILMLGYRLGLYGRGWLKTAGMRMMVGRRSIPALRDVGRAFADAHVAKAGWNDGVMALLAEDRARGARIVMATAAFGFYAEAFAEKLGIEHAVATRWDGWAIDGTNCYGEEKRRRVEEWLAGRTAKLRFVSDSFADAPLLDLADEAVFVTRAARKSRVAEARGWRVIAS